MSFSDAKIEKIVDPLLPRNSLGGTAMLAGHPTSRQDFESGARWRAMKVDVFPDAVLFFPDAGFFEG
jgi:hypothetical protein